MPSPAPEPGNHAHDPTDHPRDRPWTREEAVETLEAPDRARALDPVALWQRAGLPPGATVVDVGSGTGFFALPAARLVGLGGHVYAVDISRELVEYIAVRSRDEHLPQLATVESTVDTIPLPSGIADFVLLATVLHDISSSTVSEAVRVLRPGGRLVNLDWKKVEGPSGPPLAIRLSPSEASELLAGHGLTLVDSWDVGTDHYVLVFERSPLPSDEAPAPGPDHAAGSRRQV